MHQNLLDSAKPASYNRIVAVHKPIHSGARMTTVANPLSKISNVTVETAARLTRISMDSTERVLALQLDFAKASPEQATKSARAVAGARDVQELFALRARGAESAVEKLMGYRSEEHTSELQS